MNRKELREERMRFFYEMDMNKIDCEQKARVHLQSREKPIENEILEFSKDYFTYCQQADDLIEASSENWKINRISRVDRTILRLALVEAVFLKQVPPAVAIDEAVRLSKKYSDEASYKFVNGVLGNIISQQFPS